MPIDLDFAQRVHRMQRMGATPAHIAERLRTTVEEVMEAHRMLAFAGQRHGASDRASDRRAKAVTRRRASIPAGGGTMIGLSLRLRADEVIQ